MAAQGMTGGQSLGNAQGKISIDTSDLTRMQAVTAQAGQTAARNLGVIDGAAKRTQASMGGLGNSLNGVLGAFGVATAGGAIAAQLARFAVAADQTATAYGRQSVAALDLAGSQSRLNKLLDEYGKATGNQIDKAQSLSDVTRLQAIGFADTAAELNEFVTASRGAALALGSSQDYIIGQVQLAIANQSTMRLDQIGLGVAETEERIKSLMAADSNLTKQMAYQNAVLGLLTEKYGALATSTQAQATGAEKAAKAWKDLSLSFGNLVGPTVDTIGNQFAAFFNAISAGFDRSSAAIQDFGKWLQWLGTVTLPDSVRAQGRDFMAGLGYSLPTAAPRTIGGPSRSERNRGVSGAVGRTEAQTDAIKQWANDVEAIEREAGAARTSATRQYEQQRTDAISEYGRTVVREEQDFARNRARAVADYAKQVADVQEDAAKREADAARDYARAVADVREEAGKRETKWQRDYSEKIAALRSDSNERLVELEADYAKTRERAELDHRDRLLSAAARLDAVGVAEEQRNYARQQADAEDNHKEQRNKIQKALTEQLDDAKKAQDERLAEARAGDAERLADMQEAFSEQQAEARKDAAERLAEMQADFEQRLAQEDEDRAVQNQRRAEDHAAQMAQMAQAQAERMAKIDEQVAKEKKALEEKFLAELEAEGLHNQNWLKIQEERQKASLKLFNEWFDQIEKRFGVQGPKTEDQTPASAFPSSFAAGGWVQRGGMARVHAGELVIPASQAQAMASGRATAGGSSVNFEAINVYGAPGQSAEAIGREVTRQIVAMLETVGGGA